MNDGGPAFPLSGCAGCGSDHEPVHNIGCMSLRDRFAGMALQGFTARQSLPEADELASSAYAVADAMLKARDVKNGEPGA